MAAPFYGARWFLGSRDAVLDGYVFTALCLAGVVIGLITLGHFARRLSAEQAVPVTGEPVPAGAA